MKATKLASIPTIKRLPSYLLVVEAAHREGNPYISGTVIANELELEPIQVRKDLAITGIIGKPRLGFPVPELIDAINSFLDWNQRRTAFIVGTGNLGSALLGYSEFPRHGMHIAAAFDCDPDKIGRTVNSVPVYTVEKLGDLTRKYDPDLAILTVSPSAAQTITNKIVKAGITAIWNFTNVKIKVPPSVTVQKEDLSSGYAVLSVKIRQSRENDGA